MLSRGLVFCAVLLLIGVSTSASASWISDVTGINIDIAKIAAEAATSTPPAVIAAKIQATPPGAPGNDAGAVQLVPQSDRDAVVRRIGEFDAATSHVAHIYEDILFGVTLGSIVLGLCASISGFCKLSTLAGILSIIAAGILGVGSALPIAQNADFYRLLSAQSHALYSDAELHGAMTLSEYASFREGLKTLILFEGAKFPSRSGTQEATQSLITQLQSVRFEGSKRESPVAVN
jgi:hypothetical protein